MSKWMMIGIAIATIGGIAYYLWRRGKGEVLAEEPEFPLVTPLVPLEDVPALVGLLPYREDIYSYNRKNPLAPATTDVVYVGPHPVDDFTGFLDTAKAQAKDEGSPVYVKEGGYWVTEDGKYIKGVGW